MNYKTITIYLGKLSPQDIAENETNINFKEGMTVKADRLEPELCKNGATTGKFYTWVYVNCTEEVWTKLAQKEEQKALF